MINLLEIEQNWIKQFDKPLILAGPCSAESEEQVLKIAEDLDKSYVQVYRAGIWKPRTKPGNFEGVGAIGLGWLKKVKEKYNILTSTEVANAEHCKLALEAGIDILWIGARTTVNPFQVQEIAEALKNTDKIVLVKNPVNPDLELWVGALERLAAMGIKKLGVIHRGFSTYKKTKYRNKPQWQIALEFKKQYPNIPIICDPSHITGNRDAILEVSQQAFNFEYNGLMIETHNDPDNAWSDAKQQVTPARLLEILKELEIRKHDSDGSLYQATISQLRSEIDELDQQLLEAVSHRMKVVNQIGGLKKEHNVAVFQPGRWEEISNRLKAEGLKLNLSEELVEKILEVIHQESVGIQNDVMNKK
ncbi:MAG: chorismate mutase [Solirubrobacteraceae bacterium]